MSRPERKPIELYRYNKFDSVSDLMDRYNSIEAIKRQNTPIEVEAYGDHFEIREVENSFYLYTKKRFTNVYDLALYLVNESYDIEMYKAHQKDKAIKKLGVKRGRPVVKLQQVKPTS